MNPDQQHTPQQPDPYHQPVAYDAEGRPLYAHPPTQTHQVEGAPIIATTQSKVSEAPNSHNGHNFDPRMRVQYSNEPGVIHATREYEPTVAAVSPELQQKHEAAVEAYPHLNLSEGEYVILDIKRHIIGLLIPTVLTILATAIVLSPLAFYPWLTEYATTVLPTFDSLILPIVLVAALVVIGGAVAIWVYLQNHFYMTNESVIQEIQHSLFSRHEQTVSLGSIEDASFKQRNIIQLLFNYGTVRLSTEGEETTYRFHYVANPRDQVAILNNAVESFKNGRPVNGDDN